MPLDLTKAAYFQHAPGVYEADIADDFQCALSARITPTRCYLYLISASPSCMLCLAKLHRLRGRIDRGEFVDIERAPILRFYLTATTGKPGLPEELKRFKRRKRAEFKPATAYVPPDRAVRRRIDAERKLAKMMPKPTPPKSAEPGEVIQAAPKVVKRRKVKPVWVDKCKSCGHRREIVAWGLCADCLAAERADG